MLRLKGLHLTHESRGKQREANCERRDVAVAWLSHRSGKHHLQPMSYGLSPTRRQEPHRGDNKVRHREHVSVACRQRVGLAAKACIAGMTATGWKCTVATDITGQIHGG